jgi:DMSO reductase family type II enzyme heme b subunit
VWQQATAVEVPMSAQMISRPIMPETNAKAVTVRALHNGTQVAFLLEWQDATRNDATLRVDDFRDGAAIQFPVLEGQPFYCMGQLGGDVNIWHWKADWQAALIAQQSLQTTYPNITVDQYPFAEAVGRHLPRRLRRHQLPDRRSSRQLSGAAGARFARGRPGGGRLWQPHHASRWKDQNVQGYGEWSDGVWRVIFSRDLSSTEAEDVTLAPETLYSIAFAAWDGANQERNGSKSTSQWISFQLAGAAGAGAATTTETAAADGAGDSRGGRRSRPLASMRSTVGPSSRLLDAGVASASASLWCSTSIIGSKPSTQCGCLTGLARRRTRRRRGAQRKSK